MTYINHMGYVERRTKTNKGSNASASTRDWWLVKYACKDIKRKHGFVNMGNLKIPNWYVGKKVRFKIEVVEDENSK